MKDIMYDRIYGGLNKETVDRQLEEYPLAEGWIRQYTDHTGRFFEDISPQQQILDKESDPIFDILQKEIQKEINLEILKKIGLK